MPPLVDSRRGSQSTGVRRQPDAHWQLLPDELWAHIATFLGTGDKMVSLLSLTHDAHDSLIAFSLSTACC